LAHHVSCQDFAPTFRYGHGHLHPLVLATALLPSRARRSVAPKSEYTGLQSHAMATFTMFDASLIGVLGLFLLAAVAVPSAS
jgi:hypothetical protein